MNIRQKGNLPRGLFRRAGNLRQMKNPAPGGESAVFLHRFSKDFPEAAPEAGSLRFADGYLRRYHGDMARGWESKSVEEQVAEKQAEPEHVEGKPNPAAEAARKRQRQELELQRERILDERTSSPHRRAALEAALADIEARLASMS